MERKAVYDDDDDEEDLLCAVHIEVNTVDKATVHYNS